MNLGLFKIMSQAQANSVQKIDSKTMIGRELVIYCNANPELDAEKWIDILVQIENCFKKRGFELLLLHALLPIENSANMLAILTVHGLMYVWMFPLPKGLKKLP